MEQKLEQMGKTEALNGHASAVRASATEIAQSLLALYGQADEQGRTTAKQIIAKAWRIFHAHSADEMKAALDPKQVGIMRKDENGKQPAAYTRIMEQRKLYKLYVIDGAKKEPTSIAKPLIADDAGTWGERLILATVLLNKVTEIQRHDQAVQAAASIIKVQQDLPVDTPFSEIADAAEQMAAERIAEQQEAAEEADEAKQTPAAQAEAFARKVLRAHVGTKAKPGAGLDAGIKWLQSFLDAMPKAVTKVHGEIMSKMAAKAEGTLQ